MKKPIHAIKATSPKPAVKSTKGKALPVQADKKRPSPATFTEPKLPTIPQARMRLASMGSPSPKRKKS